MIRTAVNIVLLLVITATMLPAQTLKISGRVLDTDTGLPLAYANIRVSNTGVGTAANVQGDYLLKVLAVHAGDSLEISFVGYTTVYARIPTGPEPVLNVSLKPAATVLREVTVSAATGLSLLKEAIRKIPENYDTTGRNLQAFYREQITLGKDSISYVEAVVDLYKGAYTKPDADQARVVKGRTKNFNWHGDPLYGWLSGLSNGIRGSVMEDLIKYIGGKNNPLNSANFDRYSFDLRDEVVRTGKNDLYVIDFRPRRPLRSAITVFGQIYVNAADLAITQIDLDLTTGGVKYLNRHRGPAYRIMTVAYQCAVHFSGIHESISFSELNGKWQLKQINKAFVAQVTSGKRDMHDTPWEARTHFVVTDIKEGVGEHIQDDVLTSGRSIGTLINKSIDPDFWENYNVVQADGRDTAATKPVATRATRRISNRQNGFNRADSLQGSLSPLRTCYDVSFYHLDVELFPDTKSIRGSSRIRFVVKESFRRMQIDLFPSMAIEKILFGDVPLKFTREFNAVYVDFPIELVPGGEGEIIVFFSGKPKESDLSVFMDGGFLWKKDNRGNPWVMSVCQGDGASLWWPNKDHLSDEPDSARITVTVPKGLREVSNGKLRSETILDDGRTRFDWYVSYPINNYNMAVNAGNYVHRTDTLQRGGSVLRLNYYFVPEHEALSQKLFQEVKPTLRLYEKWFGPYPFARDEFTVMESLYPMEHQSAVSIGELTTDTVAFSKAPDSLVHKILLWHEVAHEWWGNSISVKDLADFWIQEGFATYCEMLVIEDHYGYDAAADAANGQLILNKEPITGIYGVNHIHYDIGDIYNKTCLMLNTLRHVVANDTTWFRTMRLVQDHFRYKTTDAQEFLAFMNSQLGGDYLYIFDQYLHYASIPVLEMAANQKESATVLRFRWKANVKGFRMPVEIEYGGNRKMMLRPTDAWQTITLANTSSDAIEVNELDYYVEVDSK